MYNSEFEKKWKAIINPNQSEADQNNYRNIPKFVFLKAMFLVFYSMDLNAGKLPPLLRRN